jgi:hypothetical protein
MLDIVVLTALSTNAFTIVLATVLATRLDFAFAIMVGMVQIALSNCAADALTTVHAPWTGVVNAISHGQGQTVPFACASVAAVATGHASTEHAFVTLDGPQTIALYVLIHLLCLTVPISTHLKITRPMFVLKTAVVTAVVNMDFVCATSITMV